MSDWQPIEIATHQGWIIGHSPKWELPEILCWSHYSNGWVSMDDGTYQPTLWIPIPALPRDAAQGGAK
jgi:hypothetical protein